MKVIKEFEHCLLLNYFGLNNKYYLAVTVMTYFDLNDPANPLKEQDMWPFVQGELGKDAILDMAMPKPKGEFLVWGRCFSPDGKPRGASRVTVRVGSIEKILYIFGNRYWKKAAGVGLTVSEPEPFIEMPVTYGRAFGGAGFDRNPSGRGFAPVIGPSGFETHPLPNIEDPGHLVGSPSDRPDPAGFAPLDFAWPQRAKKLGTYDNKWFQERWPFYPDDMNWTYFNAAPEDQQMEDFFQGNESFSISGMHPKKPVIESRLPGIKHRFFVNQLTDVNKPAGETVFKEALTHVDTVWLFPHAERGIAVSRGSVEVKDDEALDVPHLYIVSEAAAREPGTIEKYYEQFKKRIDRAVTIDLAPQMEKMKEKLTQVADRLKDLPLEINDSIAQNLGHAPKSVKTPVEVALQSIALIEKQKKLLAAGEKKILAMKAEYGHMMKMDASGFTKAASRLDNAARKLAAIPGEVKAFEKEKAEHLGKMKEQFKKSLTAADLSKMEESGVGLDSLFEAYEGKPGDPWHEQGMRFIEACRDRLTQDPGVMSCLRGLGLRPYTLKRSWIGINREKARFERVSWGLKPPEEKTDDPEALIIPAGLVIPRFEGAKLQRITLRPVLDDTGAFPVPKDLPGAILDEGKDAPVEGSQEFAMALGPGEGKPFVRAADELEAILLHQELGDFCAVVAMKDPSAKLDKDTGSALQTAPQFLVVSYPDTPGNAGTDISAWKKLCPEAQHIELPAGRNLFEAKKAGADIWQWVADALRPGVAPGPETKPKDVDVSEPGAVAALIPRVDVEALIKKIKDELTAKIQPGLDTLAAKKKEGLGLIGKELAKQGVSLDEIMKNPAPSILKGANPFTAAMGKYAEKFAGLRKQLTSQGTMNSDVDKKLSEIEKMSQKILSDSAKRFDEGKARLAASKAKIEAGPPDWAKKLLAGAGIDPDDPALLKPLTREEVIERHAKGLSLSTKSMMGLDLSGLDLTGADLRQANLQKANLSGSILDGADLSRAIAGEADLSKASLKDAKMVKGIFQKARFPGAHLSGADMTKAVMSEADLTGADLTGATIVKALLEKTVMKNVRAVDALASQAYLLSADISGADFSGANLEKAVFLKTKIDGANFSKSRAREAAFIEAKGEKLNFSGADMHNSRILQGSVMKGSDFTNTRADRASWMKSDLSGSDFRGSTIERGLLQECDLSGTNFSGVKAKQARLTKSDMSDSDLKGINLFQGSLRKSKLVRTDLRRANLYGAEFYRTGVGETKLDDANLKMTKLYKRTDLLPEPPKEKKK
ncbi:MAG TPA: DUF2169 domain-containing protein [Syntrophorhabdaceae bacterium]|nr:DUF2169 domain-containing protein [Syntrophorhabdaceae bacterium]